MNHTRILRFEVMEPRIALTANVAELLANLQAGIAANGFDPQRAQEMLEQIVQSGTDSPLSQPTTPPANELGETPVVAFQLDARDMQDPPVNVVQAGSEYPTDLKADIASHSFDTQWAQEIQEQIAQSGADSPVSLPTTSPANELGETPVVRFRVDIRDLQDQPVTTVQAGGEYLAKIFVQDMRDPTSVNLADSGGGGLYQAWVDLEFSENLHPTGNVRVNEAFSSTEFDPEVGGSFLRNLGGVASNATAFGGAEQFLLEAPFTVDSTDAPNHIQVVPSTSQHDPVLLFGSFGAVPIQNINSLAFDLPSATNANSNGSTSPPLVDSSDDLSAEFPSPTPPAIALPNSGVGSHEATSDDDSVALVSYVAFSRDNDPVSRWKWRDEDDWWRSHRGDDEKNHRDDWSELDWPDEEGKLLNAKSADRSDPSFTDDGNSDEDETELNDGKRQSKHAGLFYDEALFLEGALVETFQSKFRLHLQIISPQRHANDDTAESAANKHASNQRDGFIDIAEILTPNRDTKPWHDNVDDAIAGHRYSPLPEYHGPAIDWGTIEPLPENTPARQPDKQAEANQKLPDQRTPLAMNQSANNSPETGLPPTVR